MSKMVGDNDKDTLRHEDFVVASHVDPCAVHLGREAARCLAPGFKVRRYLGTSAGPPSP